VPFGPLTLDIQVPVARRSEAQAMISHMTVITVLAAWVVASVFVAAGWTMMARGGLREDRLRGHLADRS
jgi:hypothetical protein